MGGLYYRHWLGRSATPGPVAAYPSPATKMCGKLDSPDPVDIFQAMGGEFTTATIWGQACSLCSLQEGREGNRRFLT